MKILIADKFEQVGVERLGKLGCHVVSEPETTAETLPEALRKHDPEILIVRSTKVTAEALDAGKSLNAIIRAGAGYDTIDVAAASTRGVFVCNCSGKNSIAVAELAWGLILSCDRRIPDQTADLRAGTWNKKEYSKARGLYGRTLGVIGLGQIGMEVLKRGQAFGMNVIAWSRSLTPERAEMMDIRMAESPLDVARRADIVTLHVAATADTKNLVNQEFCSALKDGAILINTTRGSVVDQQALRDAMKKKKIRVGLDVFANEPGSGEGAFADPIVKEAGVCGTHHVGASTDQAQDAIALEAVRIVEHYLTTGQMINSVNIAHKTPATTMLTIRMKNQPGVLAHVFYILGQAGINVEQMDNVIYEGAEAACAHIALDEPVSADLVKAIEANPHVISAACTGI